MRPFILPFWVSRTSLELISDKLEDEFHLAWPILCRRLQTALYETPDMLTLPESSDLELSSATISWAGGAGWFGSGVVL